MHNAQPKIEHYEAVVEMRARLKLIRSNPRVSQMLNDARCPVCGGLDCEVRHA